MFYVKFRHQVHIETCSYQFSHYKSAQRTHLQCFFARSRMLGTWQSVKFPCVSVKEQGTRLSDSARFVFFCSFLPVSAPLAHQYYSSFAFPLRIPRYSGRRYPASEGRRGPSTGPCNIFSPFFSFKWSHMSWLVILAIDWLQMGQSTHKNKEESLKAN